MAYAAFLELVYRGRFWEARQLLPMRGVLGGVAEAHLALWTGDRAIAQHHLDQASRDQQAAALELAAAWLALGEVERSGPLLQTPPRGLRSELLAAHQQALLGRLDLAAQSLVGLGGLLLRGTWEGRAWAEFLLAARSVRGLGLGLHLTQMALQLEKRYPPLSVYAHFVAALGDYAAGRPFSRSLQAALHLAEEHGLIGLLGSLIREEPPLFYGGLEAGVVSPHYPLAWPQPDHGRLAALVGSESAPMASRFSALSMLARQPLHPQTQGAARSIRTAWASAEAGAAAEERANPGAAAGERATPGSETDDGAVRGALGALAERLLVARVEAAPEGERLRLRSFGLFQLTHLGKPLCPRLLKKAQVLFTLLLAREGRAISRQWLAEELWPDLEGRASANNLRVTIHSLRQALGRVSPSGNLGLVTEGESIRLVGWEQIDWDAKELERRVEAARQLAGEGRESAVVSTLTPILVECRGGFLPDPAFDGFFEMERHRITRLVYEALVELSTAHLQLGQPAEALVAAEVAVESDPLDELGHLLLMRAHAALGYPHRALESFRRYEEAVAREVGGLPSAGALRLLGQLLPA